MRKLNGRYITREGYVRVHRPGGVGKTLWVLEHLNGDKTDNRRGNLELWVRRQPNGQRVVDVLAWAHEVIARYESGRAV